MNKKKISRILGVALTLVLLSSFFVASAPVGAGTQAWSTLSTPGTSGLVLDAGNTWTGPFAMTSDGSAIYAGSDVGGLAPAMGKTLVKSTDGGRTWKAQSAFPAIAAAPGAITDILISSIDDNTVYVTDGIDIFKTTDGGATWVVLSNLFTSLGLTSGLAGSGWITSIDVGYLGTNPYIFASLSAFGAGAVGGGAYVAQEAVFGMPWASLLIATDRTAAFGLTDVTQILVDPANFATTQMIMALAQNRTGPVTMVTTKYAGAQWGSTVADVPLVAAPAAITSALYTGSIWLPDNFSSSLASGNMQVFVGVAPMTATQGDVFWVLFGTPTGLAFDLSVSGAALGTAVTGLDGMGPASNATLMASGYTSAATGTPRVFRSPNSGATWAADIKRPTGSTNAGSGTALSSVLMLDANTTIVGTHGADNGVSISTDGVTWNGISLLNYAIATIDDLDFRADGSMFMAVDGGTNDSIWRNASSWERVWSTSLDPAGTFDPELVESSPDGTAVFMADIGGPFTLYRSLDAGQTWAPQVSANPGGAIPSWVIVDASTVLVGGAGVIYQTTNNGVIWFTRTAAIGTVQSFAVDPTSGNIMAAGVTGGAGTVAVSANNGTSWSVASNTIAAINTAIVVAYGATNGVMYATGTDSSLDAGVWKRTTGSWSQIDTLPGNPQSSGDDVKGGTGLVSGPGISGVDMVYAADGSTGLDGISRIKSNRTEGELLALAGAAMGLWYQPGSNILYTLIGATIRTYTDTLNIAGVGVNVSGVTTGTATVSWVAVPNATGYFVSVNTTAQTDYYKATSAFGGDGAIAGTTTTITGLAANTKYNVSVWARLPVSSFLFGPGVPSGASADFTTTALAPVAPPANLLPINGAVNVPINDVAFGWAAPTGGAVSYNWQLSLSPTFATQVAGSPQSPTLTLLVHPGPLNYDTSYYWRVQSVGTSGAPGAWVTSVFTTVAEPAPVVTVPPAPTPTIIIPPAPTPTIVIPPAPTPTIILPTPVITIPPANITVVPPDVIVNLPTPIVTTVPPAVIQLPEEDTPVYIWAIVAIGAILVIAVIVLIVRTRRVV